MRGRRPRRSNIIPALAACFSIGILVGWWLKSGAPMPAVSVTPEGRILEAPSSDLGKDASTPAGSAASRDGASREVAATTGEPLVAPTPASAKPSAPAIEELHARNLRLPIDDADVARMEGGFAEGRAGHEHQAVDILAPRNTLVRAVEDGSIAKLFLSKAGGTTIYQFDPSGRFVYYYAHLERYADGLHEGQHVSRGEVIGYVGTSGNAPPNTPHLHFAVFELDADRHWWKGRAIDPYLIFRP
jgi:peptidoglycan LD-endopeptidase LytH